MPRVPWLLSALFQALMVVHYFRKRPEGYWLFVIIFLGPLGALVYFVLEVLPDLRVKPPWLARMERRRRRQWLEQVANESPALEHLQELGEICAAEGEHAPAIELFSRVLARDPDCREARYGRAKSLVELGQAEKAIADLEPVVRAEPNDLGHHPPPGSWAAGCMPSLDTYLVHAHTVSTTPTAPIIT